MLQILIMFQLHFLQLSSQTSNAFYLQRLKKSYGNIIGRHLIEVFRDMQSRDLTLKFNAAPCENYKVLSKSDI